MSVAQSVVVPLLAWVRPWREQAHHPARQDAGEQRERRDEPDQIHVLVPVVPAENHQSAQA